MSIYYEIMEHLVVNDIPDPDIDCNKNTAVGIMQYQLSLLGALMLQNEAKVGSMKLTADDRIYEFSGSCPDGTFKELMMAMSEAVNIDLSMDYEYTVYGMNELSHEVGPVLGGWMGDFDAEDAEGIFYTVWSLADCECGAGTLSAYGNHNGKLYSGPVEFESVESFQNGEWYADEDICAEGENLSPEIVSEVEAISRELSTLSLSEYDERSVSGNDVSFYLNDVMLKSKENFEKLTMGYKKLAELVINNSDCGGSLGEYRDLSGADARLMKIDYDENDMPHISIAEIK